MEPRREVGNAAKVDRKGQVFVWNRFDTLLLMIQVVSRRCITLLCLGQHSYGSMAHRTSGWGRTSVMFLSR